MSHDDELEDEGEELSELDLTLENQALLDDLKIMGMGEYGKSGDLDPGLENAFLKHVMMFEEADRQPHEKIRTLFPDDFGFPPADSMTAGELAAKLAAIRSVLEPHQIYLELHPVPDKAAYEYFVNEVLNDDVMFPDPPEGFRTVLDGCSGCCDECFQKDYCDAAKEILGE